MVFYIGIIYQVLLKYSMVFYIGIILLSFTQV